MLNMQWTLKLLLLCAAIGAATPAVGANGARALPAFGLIDEGGNAFDRSTFAPGRKWVLVVVDASRTLTDVTLAQLLKEEGSWNPSLAIVVIGDHEALVQLRASHPQLSGAHWFRSSEQRLTEKLKISGVPTLLGMEGASAVAWQHTGMPESAEAMHRLLSQWLDADAAEAQ